MKRKVILIIMLLLLPLPVRTDAGADPAALLRQANAYYLQGDYRTAQEYYQKVRDMGIATGKLYYNLGNASFRMGKIGEAIGNYLLARQLIPRDEDLAANLAYARHEVKDRIEPSASSMTREIFFWYDRLSVKEMVHIFLLCNFLCWSGLIIRLFSRRPAINRLILLSLSIGIAMGGSAALRIISPYLHKTAVVIVQQAAVQSGMDPASDTLVVLPDGAEVSVERVTGGWSLIRVATDKKGWVKNEHLKLALR